MEKRKNVAAKIVKFAAERALMRNAHQTSCVAFYQPKAPALLSRYKKERHD